MENLLRKKILLTGASGGIGVSLATILEESGAELFLVSYSEEETEELNKVLKKSHKQYFVDLTDRKSLKGLIEEIKADTDELDVLINSAGIGIYKDLDQISEEEWDRALELNTTAPFILSKELLHLLQKEGSLVMNIGSGAGVIPMAGRVSYNTTKFGLRGMSLSLSEEFKTKSPDFCLITLGSVVTAFGNTDIEEKRRRNGHTKAYLEPGEVAEKLLGIILSENRKPEYEIYPEDYWVLREEVETLI